MFTCTPFILTFCRVLQWRVLQLFVYNLIHPLLNYSVFAFKSENEIKVAFKLLLLFSLLCKRDCTFEGNRDALPWA